MMMVYKFDSMANDGSQWSMMVNHDQYINSDGGAPVRES